MRNEVSNWQLSWLPYTNLQNKTQCVDFFTDGPFLLRDRKKVGISIFFQNVCLDWKLFPIKTFQGGKN